MGPREIYRATRKTPDLIWNAYVCRPIAAVLLWVLAPTRVTPNQVTLSSVWVAAAAAVLLIAMPGYSGLLSGVLVYELSYVLDCADGMLARLRNCQSTRGHLLDFLMDEIKAFIIFSAVSVRLYRESDDAWFLLLGLLGLVALASGIALTTFLRRPEIASPGATPAVAPEHRSARSLLAAPLRFLVHYPSYIWLAAAVGRIEAYFYPYLCVHVLYALGTFAKVSIRFGWR